MKKRRSLREINDEIFRLCDEGIDVPPAIDTNGDYVTLVNEEYQESELENALNALALEQEEKIQEIGEYCLFLDAEIAKLEKEIARLTAWKGAAKRRREWLSSYCLSEMVRAGVRKVIGKFVRVSIRKSPVSVEAEVDVSRVDAKYVQRVVTYKIDKRGAINAYRRALKAHTEAGGTADTFEFELEGFAFITDKEHLRIG